MKKKYIMLLSLLVLIVAMATVSAADSDNSAINDNTGSDVAVDSSSSTSQATDTSTHTDSSVDKTSDASTTSSQKTDTTSQQTTQKVSQKTSENTQTTSDTTTKASSDTTVKDSSDTVAKVSSDTTSQSSQSTNQSTQQSQSYSNTTNENINTVNEKVVDTTKSISTEDNVTSESAVVYNITPDNIDNLNTTLRNLKDGDTLNFEGTFNDLYIEIDHNITMTSYSSAEFTNSRIFVFYTASGATISNLYIENSEEYTGAIFVNMANDVTVTNNTIYMNFNNKTATGIELRGSNGSTVTNNKITIQALTKNITYYNNTEGVYEGTVDTYGIGVFNSSNVNISNNDVIAVSSKSNDTESTITAIAIQGSDLYSCKVSDIDVTYNNIYFRNDWYAYGITVCYNVDDAYVAHNTIRSLSSTDYCDYGVNVAGSTNKTKVVLNTINLRSKELSYGITFEGSALKNIYIADASFNNITLSSNASRGIEYYCIDKGFGYGNELTINGNYTSGIGIGGSNSIDLYWNDIVSNGLINSQYNTYEDIPIISSGIIIVYADPWYINDTVHLNSSEIFMLYNNITTTGEYSINLTADDCNITKNNVSSNTTGTILYGDNSILVNGENNVLSGNSASRLQGYEQEDDEDETPVIHNINQDNYDKYFREETSDTPAGLYDIINDGDVLNIQGDINVTYNLIIDKAVNLTSLDNTGRLVGDGYFNRSVTIITGGSNTNITNITIYNMELFTEAAHNLTIDHLNHTNIGVENLGEGLGVLSMRNASSYINITNSYFHSEDNGGHSTLVLAGASYVNIDNCTVEGVGRVGNLVYLTTYNTAEGTSNGHLNITNCRIIGPDPSPICYAMAIYGTDVYMANNFINYTGDGIRGQWGTGESENNYCINNTIVGTGISLAGAEMINNTALYIIATDSNVINNTVVDTLTVNGENIIVTNNTMLCDGSMNSTQGYGKGIFTINTTNATVTNNKMNGTNITVTINGTSNIVENNTFHILTNSQYFMSNIPIITINSNCNDNQVRYNDMYNYDYLRGTYTTGDECVNITDGATGNIVQDNYGNISGIIYPTNDTTNYTYITKDVSSMEELISALDDIKTNGVYSNDTKYVINLLEGTYTVTDLITWGNGTSDVKEVKINGNGQTINGNGFSSVFLNIDSDYSLILNNLTITNFTLNTTITNDGNLIIENCLLDNAGIIHTTNSVSSGSTYLLVNNTNFTQTAIITDRITATTIFNSNFYDTDLGNNTLIRSNAGNLTFFNNTVTNITAKYIIDAEYQAPYNPTTFIEQNEFTNLTCSSQDIYVFTEHHGDSEHIGGDINTMMNNVFRNGVIIYIEDYMPMNATPWIILNNTYDNCSLPTNITSIDDTTVSTEDFTTTLSVTVDKSYGSIDVDDGQLVVYINDVEYKSFDVVNGSATITIENSALNYRRNTIDVKYVPTSGYFNGSSISFMITDTSLQYTYEYNVTSFEEIKQALSDAKTNNEASDFVINLLDGEYIVTETLNWSNSENDIYNITINCNGQTIDLNGNTFLSVANNYTLTINNINIQDSGNSNKTAIENYGNLTISDLTIKDANIHNNGTQIIDNVTFINANTYNNGTLEIETATFKNSGISSNGTLSITNATFDNTTIYSAGNLNIDESTFDKSFFDLESAVFNLTNSNITNTAFNMTNSNASVSNNYFYDTDASQFTDLDGMFYYEGTVLQFFDNNINNVTGKYILYSGIGFESSDSYIHDNTFSNTDYGIYFIYSDMSSDTYEYMYDHGHTQIINNTFINSTYTGRLFNSSFDLITYPDLTTISNNTYENCNLGINISTIPDSTTKEDFTTTVTLTADSVYNTTVNDGKVIVYVNGKEYESFDVSNGQTTITIEASELELFADNNIEVKYATEDGTITNATTSFTLTLKMDDGIIVGVNQTTIYAGDTVTLTAQVAHNDSLAKDGYVIFKVNGKTIRDENGNPITVQVDENGMATLNYTIPDTNSNEYNITAVYNGENTILRSTETITTTLKKATIIVNPITAKAGQTVTLTAYITDQNGQAVNSGKLIFKLNGKTLKDSNGNTLYATINNGVATLVYTIPDNYSAKDYILTAVYQGTGFERSEANSTLTLTKATPIIVPDSTVFGTDNKITITQGTESIQIKATINDPETNAPIDTTTVVTIKINDKTVTQQYVSDGQIDMTIYTSSFKNPEYNITVVVGENSQYERTSYEATLEIVSPTSLKTDTSYNGTLEVVTPAGLETGSSYNGTLIVAKD